jgi:hypothetical protein
MNYSRQIAGLCVWCTLIFKFTDVIVSAICLIGMTKSVDKRRLEHLMVSEWGPSLLDVKKNRIYHAYKSLNEDDQQEYDDDYQLPEIASFLKQCNVVIIQTLNQVTAIYLLY